MIETRGFMITMRGGKKPASWKVEGPFFFEGEEHYDLFVNDLMVAWDNLTSNSVTIQTLEHYEDKKDQK